MQPLLTRAVLATILLCLAASAIAGDDGRYAQSQHREWFNSLTNSLGYSCCSNADGLRLDDPDWEVDGTTYRVKIDGRWLRVPADAIVKASNRVGYAIVWLVYDGETIHIRCFLPGTTA